jgi:rubredoxin
MKCKRCTYIWLPMPGLRVIPRTGNTHWVDMGICRRCDSVTSRIHTATPGDMVAAELWGSQRFEVIRVDE